MESTFHGWAGDAWADWLFMLGLLAIGFALTAGVALRLAAVAGTVMMALMWIAKVYAVVLIALAAAGAGATWGMGRAWARLSFVSRHRWLL